MSDPEPDQGANVPLDPSTAVEHSPFCRRRKAPPVVRLSWGMKPELFCPECGRYGPATDQRDNDRKAP